MTSVVKVRSQLTVFISLIISSQCDQWKCDPGKVLHDEDFYSNSHTNSLRRAYIIDTN